MPSFIEIENNDAAMTKFKNRFAQRRQIAVMNKVKTAEGAGAVLLLQAIQNNIVRQGLVDTGGYHNSWHVTLGSGYAKVGTPHPAGPRLEYGFFGLDSLGRLYNQPARPHVRPAIAEVKQEIIEKISLGIRQELE